MRISIQRAEVTLGLRKNGILLERVGAHSFPACGSMALTFTGVGRQDIEKMGWWSLETFLIYIHDQITDYSEGWTSKMAVPCSYFNLEGALR